MSDQEDKNIEQIGEEGETSDAAADDTVAVVDEPEPHQPPPEAAAAVPPPETAAPVPPPAEQAPRGKGSSAVAWLALLLAVALAGAAGWYYQETQGREAALLDRVAELEALSGKMESSTGELDSLADDIKSIASQRESRLEQLSTDWQRQLQAGLGKLEQATNRQSQSIQRFESQLAEQRAELARYSANDRQAWLLAEAEYLLRLANQRMIMAGDTVAAQALLNSADGILRELDDVGLHEVRGAVAADLAAVRAVPKIDVEGLYLRLAALIEQADKLVIFQMPEQEQRVEEAPAEAWQDRLRQGYEEALHKLSDYIIIRRRDVPMQVLMDPQWEGLVRQNLRMLLEQAQVALLSDNQTLYRESLERALHWVGEFFESDEAAARAMAREITQLSDQQISVELPDISRSLRTLDDAIEQRLQQGGGE